MITEFEALKAAYPEKDWSGLSPQRKPNGYWKDTGNHKDFMEQIGKKLGIKTLDDWNSITTKDIIAVEGGASLLTHYSGSLLRGSYLYEYSHRGSIEKYLSRSHVDKRIPQKLWVLERPKQPAKIF
jgi:hypothetical protein